MNLNIYIEDRLAKDLSYFSLTTGQAKNAIIREAIRDWIQNHQKIEWSDNIKKFNGINSFPAFENFRDDLTPALNDPLS